ncbi:hypothetical protein [Leptospira adleri]|uniref:Uncharacterized protein n=1 Tax=Leptospira adleri TaxID=2023186 RepID=A0A2M9YP59_9LEPT|nr:hypothetical protein [Leptospira adleri]PJZ53312.1 hypothetical protein CH380_10940 [Leptospira adleri]PJZ63880.1 hypothetical protein CH376_00170 [Leptospira adleri]
MKVPIDLSSITLVFSGYNFLILALRFFDWMNRICTNITVQIWILLSAWMDPFDSLFQLETSDFRRVLGNGRITLSHLGFGLCSSGALSGIARFGSAIRPILQLCRKPIAKLNLALRVCVFSSLVSTLPRVNVFASRLLAISLSTGRSSGRSIY